jgi:large subunit ribosomal protein L13
MRSAAMKSYLAKPGETGGQWRLIDASDRVLGRLATEIAMILMGKDKPDYTPHVLTGDFVCVVNAEKIQLTGNKALTKEYQRYSYYPGGRKVTSITEVMAKHPERVVQQAVKRMLPKNKLGRKMLERLKVYAGPEHPHAAQNPEPYEPKTK